MNAVEQLRDELAGRYPGLKFDIDAPARDRDPWFLDVSTADGIMVTVEWRDGEGFGVSIPWADDYGSGPDHVAPDLPAAAERVAALLSGLGIEAECGQG
jgi:hypothetical protein